MGNGGDGSGPSKGYVDGVQLVEDPAASATVYGCGGNPAGSLVIVDGSPRLGTRLTIGLDNPLGTQNPGTTTTLMLCSGADPAFPCGSPLAGYSMFDPLGDGELLVDTATTIVNVSGTSWDGPGSLATVTIDIPNNASLLGITAYAQGILTDPAPTNVATALTEAVELKIGP